ncbi:hypothetical protein RRF57_005308 [Xylaria bambusicola]|uniref:Uncharacterized protein n=1 Tax=Xylaria bambusicola TaxID=326684 RepID=A0AAN7UHP8_9PEZI
MASVHLKGGILELFDHQMRTFCLLPTIGVIIAAEMTPLRENVMLSELRISNRNDQNDSFLGVQGHFQLTRFSSIGKR